MRTLSLFLLLLPLLFSCQPKETMVSPEPMGEKIFQLVKAGNWQEIESYYQTKEEFRVQLEKSDRKEPTDGYVRNIIEGWENRKTFVLEGFKGDEGHPMPDWNSVTVDEITWGYQVPASDIRVDWPKSKDYAADSNLFTMVRFEIYFHDDTQKFLMGFDLFPSSGEWKFSPEGSRCFIMTD